MLSYLSSKSHDVIHAHIIEDIAINKMRDVELSLSTVLAHFAIASVIRLPYIRRCIMHDMYQLRSTKGQIIILG